MAAYFPVSLNLRGRRCLVVGGGPVAARKADALAQAGAHVLVVASRISDAMEQAVRLHSLELRRQAFSPADLDGAYLVVAATSDNDVNRQVAAEARSRGVLVNVADDPSQSDFITPAVVRRGDVQIAITTGGRSPALARHLRERIQEQIGPEYSVVAEALAAVREELRREGLRVAPESWQEAISDELLAALRDGDIQGAIERLRTRLRPHPNPLPEGEGEIGRALLEGEGEISSLEPLETSPQPPTPNPWVGRIVLVGAGPGDPGLITVAGKQAIAAADVIVYDRLVNPTLLEGARGRARLVYAGKRPGPMTQEEINELLCAEALAGNVVVRLKGGDPFVFGRGGEEALAAVRVGVPFSVIPGVSAAIAVPAYAGIPVTHRGVASTFTILTGHEDPAKPTESVDWDTLARLGGTLVLLMGVDTLAAICRRLVESGLPPQTPAAVIQCGTTPDQRVVTGTVADIPQRAQTAGIQAPATAVIGQVAAMADLLAWWQPHVGL